MLIKTKDDALKEIKCQLSKFLMSNRHTIDWLETESKTESEYPIAKLAIGMGYNSTTDLLRNEFAEYVRFVDRNIIEAKSKLYDTPELQHILSLQKRTVLKERNRPAIVGPPKSSRAPVEARRPRHIYGHRNEENYESVVIRRRIRIIEEPPRYRSSGRIVKKKHRSTTKSSPPPPRQNNQFRLDCRNSPKVDLLENILELIEEYGYKKPGGRLTSLHLANLTVPAIVDWEFLFKRISNITAKHAKVTLINDVQPNALFLEELDQKYGIQREEDFFDSSNEKTYAVFSGTLKTRIYKIYFLINSWKND